jgi:hypothetical protein
MHQVKPAAVAAAGVFAFLVARTLVSEIGTTIYWVTSGVPSSGPNSYPEALGWSWQAGLTGILDTALPLAVGTFLVFWRLLSIRGELRVSQVVGRGTVAAAAGAVLAGGVHMAIELGSYSVFPADDVGGLYGLTPIDMEPIYVVLRAVSLAVVHLPLVVLAGVLLWVWLRRNRPMASVSGVLDEV